VWDFSFGAEVVPDCPLQLKAMQVEGLQADLRQRLTAVSVSAAGNRDLRADCVHISPVAMQLLYCRSFPTSKVWHQSLQADSAHPGDRPDVWNSASNFQSAETSLP